MCGVSNTNSLTTPHPFCPLRDSSSSLSVHAICRVLQLIPCILYACPTCHLSVCVVFAALCVTNRAIYPPT